MKNTTSSGVANCKTWILKHAKPLSNISQKYSSYWLKHLVSAQCGDYVSNDDFVIAATLLGYKRKCIGRELKDWTGQHFYFNMGFGRTSFSENAKDTRG